MVEAPPPRRRPHSAVVVDGVAQAPSRAMLYPVGFAREDFAKAQVGVASTWSMVTPCNMHIDALADAAAQGADEAGAKSVVFNTITVSDGISMGTPYPRRLPSLAITRWQGMTIAKRFFAMACPAARGASAFPACSASHL